MRSPARACLLAIAALATAGPATALDAKLLLRCTGYAAATGAPDAEARQPFDIAIDTGQGKGWFDGVAVSQNRPGRLLADASTYRVKWRGSWGGGAMTEWVLVDRVDGSLVGHFTHPDGQGVQRHRWGGACVPVTRRF
ncbi:hypothetical protein [Roseomonas sp. CECT 9278]|uniref:hypothetical protein n=1 Tax=Roseomonas sp. CECT 9278 TaxID=2845823 RepID=UPI001E629692|nr:hypothetical protein [Roseomonas sp. CECT 9278]CAH0208855.1 hypothetical protein ROS9278_02117 [Roseomonas sp. CECT 9278]